MMTHWMRTGAGIVSLTLCSLLAQAEETEPPIPARSCVGVSARTRYSMGYDHLVDLKNACQKTVFCLVSTDVNPEKQSVSLAPQARETVVTFRGSPARVFTPEVECKYQ